MFLGKSKVLPCSKVGKLQTGWGAQDKLTKNTEFETGFGNGFNFNATHSIYFIFLFLYDKKIQTSYQNIQNRKAAFTGFIWSSVNIQHSLKLYTVDFIFHIAISQDEEIMFIIIGKWVLQMKKYYLYLNMHSVGWLVSFQGTSC